MKYQDLITGLENGSIKILGEGHKTNSLIDKLQHNVNHWEKQKIKYEDNIKNGVPETRENQHSGMLEFYNSYLGNDVEFGHYIEGEQHCFNCDATMYIIPLNETEIAYVDSHEYWKIADASGQKYGYIFKKEDIKPCACKHLTEAKKLVSKIEVETGNLVFQNFFRTEELYTDKENEYSRPGICSVLGRDRLMQYLATKNVGYGQMGNTSVMIYSNKKNEILVVHCGFEYYDEDRDYYTKNPEKMIENKKYYEQHIKKLKEGDALAEYIKDGKFKKRGEIGLSVWRWMCADEAVLKAHNEPKPDEYSDQVIVKVKPGTYKIEHYYDFPENGDLLCSKITKE